MYRQTFEKSEPGRIKRKLPLREMAENFGLSSPKLLEQLDRNIHYQLFCEVMISPMHPITNYKLVG